VSQRSRIVAAVLLLGFGLWASQQVRGMVALVRVDAARLGFEMMGIEVGLAAIAISVAWALPGSVSDRLGLRASRLPLGVLIAIVIGVLGLASAIEFTLSGSREVERSVARGISRGLQSASLNASSFAIAVLGTVIAPAIGEELLCRGLLQRSLASRVGPFAAVSLASLAFGWIHAEWIHGVIATTIGCYLGLVAFWSDSTRPAIAAHAANNLAALLGSTGLLNVRLPGDLALPVGGALTVLGLLTAWWFRPRGETPRSDLQPQRDSADA
jgi:membrane protease YdiL (CAAX protease family)